jgi:hypothetical protein
MLRSRPLRRKPPKQPSHERSEHPVAPGVLRPLRPGTYAGGLSGASVEKSEPQRNRALLDMARDRPCLLQIDGVCTGDTATTVACHSNLSIHGKAGARKADDQYSVWGCMACHRWLDQGRGTFLRKESMFMLAHLSQVLEWRRIAADVGEPQRFRQAAQWALDRLNATPIGGTA